MVMYEHADKQLADRLKYEATIHGLKVEGSSTSEKQSQRPQAPEEAIPDQENFVFRSQEDYRKMSEEERINLTKRMKSRHKQWYSGSAIKLANLKPQEVDN